MFTQSLDKDDGHDWLTGDGKPGDRPRPLKSSWHLHFRQSPPPRPNKVIYFFDNEEGITIGKTDSKQQAIAEVKRLKAIGVNISYRPHLICEESLQHEEQQRRELNRWNALGCPLKHSTDLSERRYDKIIVRRKHAADTRNSP